MRKKLKDRVEAEIGEPKMHFKLCHGNRPCLQLGVSSLVYKVSSHHTFNLNFLQSSNSFRVLRTMDSRIERAETHRFSLILVVSYENHTHTCMHLNQKNIKWNEVFIYQRMNIKSNIAFIYHNRNKCAACFKQFNKMEHLVEHMRISFHSAHEPTCRICKKHCRSFESLREHLLGNILFKRAFFQE